EKTEKEGKMLANTLWGVLGSNKFNHYNYLPWHLAVSQLALLKTYYLYRQFSPENILTIRSDCVLVKGIVKLPPEIEKNNHLYKIKFFKKLRLSKELDIFDCETGTLLKSPKSEAEYKEQLLAQLTSNPSLLPAYQTLQKENQELKLLLEGYKLGTTKSSKQKGEDLEKYITERLQETYNGQDDISKITHVGTKADISQIIHSDGQNVGQIIYEVKNEDK
ncbi:22404_t:CDS:2, partial [Racocetra persica]